MLKVINKLMNNNMKMASESKRESQMIFKTSSMPKILMKYIKEERFVTDTSEKKFPYQKKK